MTERWTREQVLALAPDASSQKAAQGVGSPGKWSGTGVTPDALWGECKGSGSKPYRACVDFDGPAYRCSCPSRKFPCKHALGLLLLWSADGVPPAPGLADWVAEWLDQRRSRADRAEAKAAAPAGPGSGEEASAEAAKRAERRLERVTAGLSELERWLDDQIRQGPRDWEELARRLVDAQAPGAAGMVARLPVVLREPDWPGRLLGEYGLIHLLAVGYRRSESLPAGLRETIRTRVGFPVSREEVLSGETFGDEWDVLGSRDEEQDRLIARRVWLRGRATGRAALVLSFAPVGQQLDASLVTGTVIEADLAFYPGGTPLRALVARRHGSRRAEPPPGVRPHAALDEVAAALAGDPWLEGWPVTLAGVVPARVASGDPAPGQGWALLDADGRGGGGADAAIALRPAATPPWRLIAVSGGRPVTVAGTWTPHGLVPLTTWDERGQVVIL